MKKITASFHRRLINPIINSHFFMDHFLWIRTQIIWKRKYGHFIDKNNLLDINEKIQYLICFYDTSRWGGYCDKMKVRNYLSSIGYQDLLTTVYGTWKKAEDIDYSSLPEKFVLKCNHDSGSYHIINKSEGMNIEAINKSLNSHLNVKYGYERGEMYYNTIPPCIMAEEYLENPKGYFSKTLVDYKVWCFNGRPHCICVYYDRTKDCVNMEVFDIHWNQRNDAVKYNNHYRKGTLKIPKPNNLEKMLDVASRLSQGFPEVRVDFYSIGDRLIFGEMTFATSCGHIDNYTDNFLKELGDCCII